MTKDGNFKRAVRKYARATGKRYTEARAELEQGRSAENPIRPFEHGTLKAHLEAEYGIRITYMAPIDDDPQTQPHGSWPGHYPATLFVRRDTGTPWIARIYSSPADRVSRVEEDAEILRYLAAQDFPAERVAHDQPVTVLDGSGVIVTDFIPGGRPSSDEGRTDKPLVQRELGRLLGRLHALPVPDGAPSRDGGAEEHNGGFYVGRPQRDLAASMSFLASVEDNVPEESREGFEWLRDQVERADDAEGLPEAFTHGNYHLWAAVGKPNELSIVGWAGSGRGPRLPTLGWLLRTAAESGDPTQIDEVMRGYREHVELTNDELERLPGAVNMRALWLACLEFRMLVRAGHAPTMGQGWTGWRPEQGEQIAERAVIALRT